MKLLADVILVIHFTYVMFTILGVLSIIIGGIFKWNWIKNLKFRIIHLISVVLVAVEALLGATCPLTSWEYELRIKAGQFVESDITFVGRILRKIIFYDFPPIFFLILYISFALLVILLFIIIPPKRPLKH